MNPWITGRIIETMQQERRGPRRPARTVAAGRDTRPTPRVGRACRARPRWPVEPDASRPESDARGRPRIRSPMMRALHLGRAAGDRRGLRPQPLPRPLPGERRGRRRRPSSAASERCWVMSVQRQLHQARLRPRLDAARRGARASASCAAAGSRSSTNDCASASEISTSSSAPSRGRERVQLVEEHLVHDLLLERERGAALVRQRRVRDRPPLVEPTDEMVLGHEHVVEEHLVELGLAGDLHERPDLDARRLHVDDDVTRCRGASTRRGRCGRARSPTGRTARSSSRPSGPRAASRRRPAPRGCAATRGPSPPRAR